MKRFTRRIINLVHDNEGMETLEIGAIAAGAVILVGILAAIYNNASQKSNVAESVGDVEYPEGPGG